MPKVTKREYKSLGRKPNRSNLRLVIRVDLMGAETPIWRRLEIAPELRLDQVHSILQAAFDWEDYHLHEFELKGTGKSEFRKYLESIQNPPMPAQDDQPSPSDTPEVVGRKFGMELEQEWQFDDRTEPETGTTLGELLVNPDDEIYYTYDFGDGWEHCLKLEKTVDAASDAPLARCVAGRRASPPEDSGGVWSFERTIAISEDPSDPEYEDALERMDWMFGSEDFDPATFNLKQTNLAVESAISR